jgi:hypothetical protein
MQRKEERKNSICVKIVSKEGRQRVGVEHIGVAHSEKELKMYIIWR